MTLLTPEQQLRDSQNYIEQLQNDNANLQYKLNMAVETLYDLQGRMERFLNKYPLEETEDWTLHPWEKTK